MVQIALDTNTIIDYSKFLEGYLNNTITKDDINNLVEDKNKYVNDLINNLDTFFNNPVIKNLNFSSRNFPDYYAINQMYVDMIKSGNLKESQQDILINQLKSNYKNFCKNYSKLVNYDHVNKKTIKNPILEQKVALAITNSSDDYETINKQLNDVSYKSELTRMFDLGKGKDPKVQFIITSYVEEELFTHILNSKENIEASLNWSKSNPIKTYNETIIRDIMKNCSLYKFSEKAKERVEILAKAMTQPYGKNRGVDDKHNAHGDLGDSACVAGAQCIGKVFVSRNITDLRGKGININQVDHNKIAREYLVEKEKTKKYVPLSNDHIEVAINPEVKHKSLESSTMEKIEQFRNNDIYNTIINRIEEAVCEAGRQSQILTPVELIEEVNDNKIEEKPELLGLEVTLTQENIHKVEDDNRQYQSIYDINYAETQQQAKLDNTSPQTSNTDMGMGGR
ncbi:MAG: hypothetical protein MR288_00720 [Firmicutes bacterium]|nr:hypothetical protein [Bacillota bacterium]MDY5041768.1 hypothetical protein [Eubacteriales bacterium]